MTASIPSDRLDLILMTPEFLKASLNQRLGEAEQILGATLPGEWPGDATYVLSLRLKQIDHGQAREPWMLRAMVLRETGVMIGYIGFHSAPGAEYLEPYSPGGVEFGFTVFPPFRRQGYAREASIALMRWARDMHGVTRFVLSISPDNVASRTLAARLGFVVVGSHVDEMDGPEDVFEFNACGHNIPIE